MKTAPIAEVKARLTDYLDRCESEGPVVITRGGKPVAVLLVPIDDDDLERLILAHSPRFRAILAKSRRSLKAGKGLPHDEFWRAAKEQIQPKSTASRVKRKKGDAA